MTTVLKLALLLAAMLLALIAFVSGYVLKGLEHDDDRSDRIPAKWLDVAWVGMIAAFGAALVAFIGGAL